MLEQNLGTYFKLESLDSNLGYWRNSGRAALGLTETEFQLIYRVPNASAGIFHHIVDVDKVAERILVRCHATQDGSRGLTFMILCESRHSEFSPRTGSENILSGAFVRLMGRPILSSCAIVVE